MKIYEFKQNNSGGQWDTSLPIYLYIEAENHASANYKAEELGAYFNGCSIGIDCDCCGDRWSRADEFDTVADVAHEIELTKRYYGAGDGNDLYRIHYADGRIEGPNDSEATP